jgi:bifunctional oligoribonuclease and PAP phosphatase NrnA
MYDLSSLSEFLAQPRKIVITTHHKPDADALGSSLAWGGYLTKKGHQVAVVSPTDYPKFLNWMTGQSEVLIFTEERQTQACLDAIAQAELICCLDFSRLDRINDLGPIVRNASAFKLLVDHHLDPESFADFEVWNPQAAATCELIFDIIVQLGDEDLIDADLGASMYAGIMTDTGSFRHNNVTAKVHETVARLIKLGVQTYAVHKHIYDTSSIERLKMLGFVLNEKLTIIPEYRTGYITLTAEELKEYHSTTGDTEGFVNWILAVEGVVFAALIVDRTELRKISFRSVGSFPANEFATDHFQGGGHKNAAGGKSELPLEDALQKFIGLLPQYKAQLNENS